ncbi:MAG TPA: hypothetical protein VFA50_18195 [Stellaceae bacterium]|nr:hypothetical protein [Stellaceae bacterium]
MRRSSLHSGYAAVVGLLAVLLTAGTAQASFVETVVQSGPNVVVTGSGSIEMWGIGIESSHNNVSSYVEADIGAILTGATGNVDDWHELSPYFTGPTNFGAGFYRSADSASGDLVGVALGNVLFLPHGYVHGTALSNTATYDNETFTTLGLTPGSYTWSWNNGSNSDSFTLQIEPAAVPEPSALTMFLTMVGILAATALILRRPRRVTS